ncbi:hypothetical protein Slin14017_G056620 [Septoria linicola]|nr:hypothetical protein Slin14017_G056620 [Septoria linicola]
MKKAFLSAVLFSAFIAAQDCPDLSVLIFSDEICSGTGEVVQLRNATIVEGSSFRSYRAGHTNDRFWDSPGCAGFIARGPPGQRGLPTEMNELSGLYRNYNGTGDYGPCINATSPKSGQAPNCFALNACAVPSSARPDTPRTCTTTDGTYVPSGGVGASTNPPVTTTPTTTTQPSGQDPTTIPPNTTPSPTDTSAPNADVQSAISDASTTISSASRAAAALAANPTNSALAEAAESAVYDAMAANQDAINVAADYQSAQVSSDLDALAAALLTAGVAAVAAVALLTAAAANELSNAFNDVQNAAQAALANAANGRLNPRPNMRRPTQSRQPPARCTIAVEQADASSPESAPDEPVFSSSNAATKRDELNIENHDSLVDQILDMVDAGHFPHQGLLDELEELVESLSFDRLRPLHVKIQQRANGNFSILATDRTAAYCSASFQVPNYNSYMASEAGNNYSPLHSDNRCGNYDWSLQRAGSRAQLLNAPFGYAYPIDAFATEHVFEIQSVARFIEYARNNVPIFQQMGYAGANRNPFCNGFFNSYLNTQMPFQSSTGYDRSVAPAQQVYNTLEGGVGSNVNEFVYLNANINNQKGKYFGELNSGTTQGGNFQKSLAFVTRTAVLADYLNDNNVVRIYRAVSARIRQSFIDFGRACADGAASANYRQFGNINWAGVYDSWQNTYPTTIETNMQKYVEVNIAEALRLIKIALRQPERLTGRDTKARLERVRTRVADQQRRGKLQKSRFSLSRLK